MEHFPYRLSPLALAVGALVLALASAGCTKEYDFDRPDYQRGTLGEELYGIWHKDAKRAADKADQKAAMLERRHTDFVVAVDTIAPPDKLGEVDQFLQDVMSLIDDGLVQSLTRKIRVILQQAADDDALMAALAIQNRPKPEDFLSPVNGKNFIGHLMAYPRMPEVATRTTETLLNSDGIDRQGNLALQESSALADLLEAATADLRSSELADPVDTTAYSMQSVLVGEDARFAPVGPPTPLWAVRYDKRGLPLVKKTSTGLPTPFVDNDGDGLADVDAEGRWVLSTGESREVPAFRTTTSAQALLNRDAVGRGSSAGGDYVFEYVDLSKTGLHFVTRQFGELTDRGLLWDMVDATPALLGPREVKTDSQGSFSGYSADNPITDLAYAFLNVLDVDRLDEILASLADFTDRSSRELAEVVYAFDEASEILDQYPDAGMEDNQTVAYDLVPVLEQISANPELWRDFFWALRQPISRRTGEPMATLLQYKDKNPSVPAIDGPYDSCFQSCKQQFPLFDDYDENNPQSCRERYNSQQALQRYDCIRACPNDEIFSVPMDFDAPESVDNRSMFQRLFHLLRDTAAQPYGLQITEPGWASNLPPIVQLPGAAEAFLRSVGSTMDMADFVPDLGGLQPLINLIGGSSSVANLLSALSPIFGTGLSRRATPDEITRLFNQPELSADILGTTLRIDPPICKDGYVMANHHADILYASEASGMIDTIAPLACAFSAHDKEDVLAQLFVIVHDHYSSRTDLYEMADGTPSPMKGSNMRSLEPALLEIVQRGTLFDALYDLSQATERFKSDSGVDFTEQLRVLVHNATRSDDGFSGRNGESMINLADGRTVRELSRMHILMRAAEQMDERVDSNPQAKQALENMLSALYDVLLATEWPDDEAQAHFKKPGSVALLAKLTHHLSEQAAEARAEGRLSEWLTQEQMQSVIDMWDSRALPALVDLSSELAADADNRQLTDDLTNYLLGQPAGRNQAAMGLYTLLVYTLHQDTWVPLSHFLAEVIDPARQWNVEPYGKVPFVTHLLQVLHDTVEKDPEGRGLDMFARAFSNRPDGSVPISTIIDIVADYFRQEPASTTPYRAEDYKHVFDEFAGYLDDHKHGIEQLYDIVDSRTPQQ